MYRLIVNKIMKRYTANDFDLTSKQDIQRGLKILRKQKIKFTRLSINTYRRFGEGELLNRALTDINVQIDKLKQHLNKL